jgi:hypothetical protein
VDDPITLKSCAGWLMMITTRRLIRSGFVALAILCTVAPSAKAVLMQADQRELRGYAPLRANGNGGEAMRRRVRIDARDQPLAEVIRDIQQQANLELVFSSELPGLDRRITFRDSTSTAAVALLRILEGSRIEVLVSRTGQAVLVPRASESLSSLRGVVMEAVSGQPLDAADISLAPGSHRSLSDAHGRFELRDVRAGTYQLRVRRYGYGDELRNVTIPWAGELDISLRPAPTPLSAMVVRPGVFGVLEESITPRQALNRAEIETAPQLGEDPFRAIARLPGVASHDLSAAFGVRGGSNRESLLRLDGVELLEPFHLKDLDAALSIIDIDAIGGLELMTGGFGVEYGDRLGGVFDMRTASVQPGPPRTTLGISLTNARAASRGSFAGERGHWLASVRRGYIDIALALGNGEDNLSPRFYDALAKVEYQLSSRFLLAAHVLYANDKLRFHDNPDDPDLDSEYGSSFAWLRLDAEPFDRLSSSTVASVARLSWDRLGHGVREGDNRALDVRENRSFDGLGVRQDWQFAATDDVLFRWGFDVKSQDADYAYFGWAEQFRIENGEPLIDADTTTADTAAAATYSSTYLATRWRPAAALTLELGARWDRWSHISESRLTPRLNAALSLTPNTTLRLAWGQYAQAQGVHELQVQDGDTRFYPADHAEHREIGLEHAFPGAIDFRVEAYDQRFTELRPRFVNREDAGELFPELVDSRLRIDPERGFARGVEFFLRKRAPRGFNGSVMYALSSSKHRIDSLWVPRARDQRHAFATDVSWASQRGWRFSAAWQWHSGWPRTPVNLRVDTLGNNLRVAREWGTYNTARLPSYHRMDIRASRQFNTRRGRVLLFFDVYNLYGRENARSLAYYVENIVNGKVITAHGIDSLLPRIPSFGVQWEF